MSLPTHVQVELADYERQAMDEDFDRLMEFFGLLIRNGEVPYRINSRVQKAISEGYLSPAGDVLRESYEMSGFNVAALDE